jgi:hypothetical protein
VNTNTTEAADMEVGMEEVTMTTTEAEVEISAAVILEDLVVDSVKGSTVSEISIRGVRKKSKSCFRRTILPNPEYPDLTKPSSPMKSSTKIRRNHYKKAYLLLFSFLFIICYLFM